MIIVQILDSIVEWLSEQVMNILDIVNGSILAALGCDMTTFNSYFPIAKNLYSIFVYTGVAIVMLNLVWNLYKNFVLGLGFEAEDPMKLTIRSMIFIFLTVYSFQIMELILSIGGTPYSWIVDADLPSLEFASFFSVVTTIVGGAVNGSVALITLIVVMILAWNYLKLLVEVAERYIVLAILVYTAPIAFSLGAAKSTNNIFRSYCRMVGGQIFLLIMNAWCLKLFTTMVGNFISNPLMI